jgi:hypothetical protein
MSRFKQSMKSLKQHDNDIYEENDALLLLSSVIYAYWTSCNVYENAKFRIQSNW